MTDAPEPAAVFRLRVTAANLRRIVDVLNPITEERGRYRSSSRHGGEVRLRVGPDGLSWAGVDASHVAMGVARFGRPLFEEYSVTTPGLLGVDTGKVGECLRIPVGEADAYKRPEPVRTGAGARVRGRTKMAGEPVFEVWTGRADGGSGEPNRLFVRLETRNGATITRTMALVDPASIADPKVPTVEPTATAAGIGADNLASALAGAAKVADHVAIYRVKSGVAVRATADADAAADELAAEVSGRGASVYPLDFFGAFGAALKRGADVTLGWGTAAPLRLGFTFAGGAVDGYYLLAPRVTEEDDGAGDPYTDDVSGWYGWAMRVRDGPEPCLAAAGVDTIPDDYSLAPTEAERELTRWERENTVARAALAEWEAKRSVFCQGWRETHRGKDPARVTIDREIGRAPYVPGPPYVPGREEPTRQYTYETNDAYARRLKEETAKRLEREAREDRLARGRNPSGVSWGPARPETSDDGAILGAARSERRIAALEPPMLPGAALFPGRTAVDNLAEAWGVPVTDPTPTELAKARAEADTEDVAEAAALGPSDAAECVQETAAETWLAAHGSHGGTVERRMGSEVGVCRECDRILNLSLVDDVSRRLSGDDGERWTRDRKIALEAAGDPDHVLVETAPEDAEVEPTAESPSWAVSESAELSPNRYEPPPAAVGARPGLGAAGCPVCGGSGFIDSRRYSYTCPACGPDPPIRLEGPTAQAIPAAVAGQGWDGWVESMTRAAVLYLGRDAQ